MKDSSLNNKRIAKNTILLYGRMLLIMAVSLYTSRVVLNTLGVEDYGIYNVVGGIVTMFAFLNGAMVTSTQRYLTFELGKGDQEKLKTVFTTSLQIHLIIAVIVLILGETVGLWFLYNKMVIPDNRMVAAQWVFHLSILTMMIQIMSVPYNSLIVAHEQMGVFAAISIIEVVLKLAIVFVLVIGHFNKLIMYAVLLASVQLLIRFFYTLYCKHHYKESKRKPGFDKVLAKEMGVFAGWNLMGNAAATLMNTGINLLLNVFFGPAVNAARAVAMQVESAIMSFSSNFMMAVNPQITKLYAQEELSEMHKLIFRASKFSFFLFFTLSLPIFVEAETILEIWLKNVPDYTVQFVRLLLIISLCNVAAVPLQTAAAATGKVRKYQSVVGGILLAIVPIAYVVLKMGGSPISVYIVYLVICLVAIMARLLIVSPLISLSIRDYFIKMVLRCLVVLFPTFGIVSIIKLFMPQGLLYTAIMILTCVLFSLLFAYLIGMNRGERLFVNEKIRLVLNKIKSNDQDK